MREMSHWKEWRGKNWRIWTFLVKRSPRKTGGLGDRAQLRAGTGLSLLGWRVYIILVILSESTTKYNIWSTLGGRTETSKCHLQQKAPNQASRMMSPTQPSSKSGAYVERIAGRAAVSQGTYVGWSNRMTARYSISNFVPK